MPGPRRTCGPDDREGPDFAPRPRARRRRPPARVGSTCGRVEGQRPEEEPSPPPRAGRPRAPRPRTRARAAAAPEQPDLEDAAGRRGRPAGGTSRRRSRRRGSRRCAGSVDVLEQPDPRGLGQALHEQHPGMTGAPGKWPWKNSSDPVTLLMATRPPAGVVLDHAVHEHEGILAGDLADEAADVDGLASGIDGRARGARARRRHGPRSAAPPARAWQAAPAWARPPGGRGRLGRGAARLGLRACSASSALTMTSREMSKSRFTVQRDLAVEQDVDALLLRHGVDVGLDLDLELVVEAWACCWARSRIRCRSAWPSSRNAWRSRVFFTISWRFLSAASGESTAPASRARPGGP